MFTYNSKVSKQCNVPDEILVEFCDDNHFDGVDIYDGDIIAYTNELVDTYYGHSLYQPEMRAKWPIDKFHSVVSAWYNKMMSEI